MSGRGITPDMIAAWELVRESGSTGGDKWKLFAELLGVPPELLAALIAAARAEGMEAAAKVADDIHHAHARAEREARAAQDYGRSELLSAMAIGSSAAGAAIRGGSHGG